MNSQPRVLIVDRSDDTREVLRTALERRGMQTLATAKARVGLDLARRHQPDLIVLDLELDQADPTEVPAGYVQQSHGGQTPLVLLGTVRRNGRGPAEGEFIAKPYHYGPLIRRIEELLGTTPQAHGPSV